MRRQEQASRKNGWTIVAAGSTVAAIAVAGAVMGARDRSADDLLGPIRLQDAAALTAEQREFAPSADHGYRLIPSLVVDLSGSSPFDSPLDDDGDAGGILPGALGNPAEQDDLATATTDTPIDFDGPATADSPDAVPSIGSDDTPDDAGTDESSAGGAETVISVDSPDEEAAPVAESVDSWSSGDGAGSVDSDD